MSHAALVEETRRRAEAAGSPARRHLFAEAGRLLPRERISALVDPGSFREIDMLRGLQHPASPPEVDDFCEGTISGTATIAGRKVAVYMVDPTIRGGTVGLVGGRKIAALTDLACDAGIPVVGLIEGGGARAQEGVDAMAAYGAIFAAQVRASGIVPQLSVVMGHALGGAVYSPALTDFIFMIDGVSTMAIAGPAVIASVTGEVVTLEQLGGSPVHGGRTGVAMWVAPDESALFDQVRELLAFLPGSCREEPPARPATDPADRTCARLHGLGTGTTPWPDVVDIAADIVDDHHVSEYSANWARSLMCAFARLDGHPVGLVANRATVDDGAMGRDACTKGARFVRACDAYNIPLVVLLDTPGFAEAPAPQRHQLARSGAQLAFAVCEATVPKVQLVLRRAGGMAGVMLGNRSVGGDWTFAWPGATFSCGPADGDVYLAGSNGHSPAPPPGRDPSRLDVWQAAALGLVNEVIDPTESRRAVGDALGILRRRPRPSAPRKHENIPL